MRRLITDGQLLPKALLELLERAAECALPELIAQYIDRLASSEFIDQADLPDLVSGITLLDRLRRGHIPGCPRLELLTSASRRATIEAEIAALRLQLLAQATNACEGLFGATDLADAHALFELVRIFERGGDDVDSRELGTARLLWTLRRLADDGSPLIEGAANGILVSIGDRPAAELGVRLASWIDAPERPENDPLAARLQGALLTLGPTLESNPALADPLLVRVESIEDAHFLGRLPGLREGFSQLAPAARSRLLESIAARLEEFEAAMVDGADHLLVDDDPLLLSRYAAADQAARQALDSLSSVFSPVDAAVSAARSSNVESKHDIDDAPRGYGRGDKARSISALDRWRLVLGRQRASMGGRAARMARALDELYGAGRGEGSRRSVGGGAGQEESFPTVRKWAEELNDLFGDEVREEVLGRAIEHGRDDALLELDPERVRPSVELLRQVLSLRGGLGEAHLPQLRKMVARVVEQLVEELAVRVQPALTGLATPRPSRRKKGPLDLRRTVGANLHTTRFSEDGTAQITPEKLFFFTRARRSLDWRVVLLVDVSGSMEPSVVYSAMMAAILSGLPAVSVNFITFNTEVIDLSGRADDPLGLLLEISVGGGTHIAKAVRYARELISVPQHTLLLIVSDFDEGWPAAGLVAEIDHLVKSGVTALGLAALDDQQKPRFNHAVARQVAAVGMPVAALSPLALARWVGEQINRRPR